MRKKIKVSEVRLGMFIGELGGHWLDHPFWKSSFLLKDDNDLKALQASGVAVLWIDTAKGLDVVENRVAELPSVQSDSHEFAPEVRVPLEDELVNARRIQAKARKAVMSMFQEARMGNALKVGEAVALVDEISGSVMRNPSAMLSLARLKNKDDYTYMHSVAVCALMVALGRQLGFDGEELRGVGMAGLFHDIGKVGIPNEILNKPERLTDVEFAIVKQHPAKGWEILKASYDVDETELDVCLHHHERVDGNGYPDKLSGDALSVFARMGAICDVYDAITSERCYKHSWDPAVALRKMAEWRQGQFDEGVFQAFVKTVGIYPTGTLVKLQSGRLGVVTDQTDGGLLKPNVRVFFSSKSRGPIPQEIINLARSQDSIESIEDPVNWGFDLSKIA
jgi:putative nucleotidyltransferase with HDIG domain